MQPLYLLNLDIRLWPLYQTVVSIRLWPVAARFVTTARFVTKVKNHAARRARFVTNEQPVYLLNLDIRLWPLSKAVVS